MQDEVIVTPTSHKRLPWNKGKLTGTKPPLRSTDQRYGAGTMNAQKIGPYVASAGRILSPALRHSQAALTSSAGLVCGGTPTAARWRTVFSSALCRTSW
jgi:hypothetical protein